MKPVEVKEWISISEDHLDTANELLLLEKDKYREITFQCQQACEKYLKAFLVYHDQIYPKIHNLKELWDLCFSIDNAFLAVKVECHFLNNYDTGYRYPPLLFVSEEEATRALEYATKIANLEPILKIKKELNIKE
jgi:HEPN domain-containing protein